MPNNEYWSVAGNSWDDLDEVARIKMWTILFQEQVGIPHEDAESLADSIVSHAGESEIDTLVMDSILHYLEHNDSNNIDISIAIGNFLSILSDTFYTHHAEDAPKFGIKPKERPLFNKILTQYLAVACYLGSLSSKRKTLTDMSE